MWPFELDLMNSNGVSQETGLLDKMTGIIVGGPLNLSLLNLRISYPFIFDRQLILIFIQNQFVVMN